MRKLVIGVVLLLAAAPWALAQGTAGSVELTPTVGYWWGDTLARGTTGLFPYDVTIADAPAYGLRLNYRITSGWAVEAFLNHERADLVQGSDALFEGSPKLGTIDLNSAEFGFEGAFGHARLVPFIAGGLGAMWMDPSVAGATSDTRFVGNFGGGVKLFLSEQVALRFDLRWHSVDVQGSNDHHHCDYYYDCYNNNWITFTELSLGLTFVL
jgi:hypothetical protein